MLPGFMDRNRHGYCGLSSPLIAMQTGRGLTETQLLRDILEMRSSRGKTQSLRQYLLHLDGCE